MYDLAVRWAWLPALVAAGALLFWLGGRTPSSPPRPPSSTENAFVGSAKCLACHREEHAGWHRSAHARTLRPAAGATGAFDGKPVGEATPQREGNALVVRVDARDRRAPGNHRVTWVAGDGVELCLFHDARGAWRILPIAWDAASRTWRETPGILAALTGAPAPGDARQVVFNRECAHCHATRFDPGFRPDAQGDVFDSSMAEAGISCEACHGAGSLHGHEPARRMQGGSGGCVLCHGAHEFRFALPGDPATPLADVAISRNFDGPGFFPDGRRSAAHGTATAFEGSACFGGGATCLSCHAPHGEPRPTGDAMCTACHDGFARKEHTFHDAVACADCHMPRLVPLEGHRDHSIRSPEPALTEGFGVPNACTSCHADRDAAWAREAKEKWYGPADERMVRDTALVADLRGGPVAPGRVEETARDPRSPLFSRATALRALPSGHEAVREALDSAEVGLVQVACEVLAERTDPAATPALLRLLGHPARTVRVEAAYALARAGWRPTERPAGLYEAARDLLVRQYPEVPLLVRAARILDALGASDEMSILLPTITERAPRDAAPLIALRGRALTEAGLHSQALIAYDDARRIYGDPTPAELFVDSADSLAATGEVAAAGTVWREAVKRVDAARVEHAIARARLLGVEGRGEEGRAILAPLADRLAQDPAGADMLRRVRWSMDALPR